MISQAILLVEDNPDDLALTMRALKKSGIPNEVTVARDGAQAVDYLFPPGGVCEDLPGLVLLDLHLPKADGLEVLARIRADERTKMIPVVILTSSNEKEDILRSYQNGANAYLRKPIAFSDFIEGVQTLGRFWLLWNEPPPGL